MTLKDLNIRDDEARPHVVIDISPWAGEGETLTLREPDAPALFRVGIAQDELQALYPDWPETLCQSVALLAESHVAPDPGGEAPGIFYARLAAAKRPTLFRHVLASFQKAYPAATDFKAAKEEAAKN